MKNEYLNRNIYNAELFYQYGQYVYTVNYKCCIKLKRSTHSRDAVRDYVLRYVQRGKMNNVTAGNAQTIICIVFVKVCA